MASSFGSVDHGYRCVCWGGWSLCVCVRRGEWVEYGSIGTAV